MCVLKPKAFKKKMFKKRKKKLHENGLLWFCNSLCQGLTKKKYKIKIMPATFCNTYTNRFKCTQPHNEYCSFFFFLLINTYSYMLVCMHVCIYVQPSRQLFVYFCRLFVNFSFLSFIQVQVHISNVFASDGISVSLKIHQAAWYAFYYIEMKCQYRGLFNNLNINKELNQILYATCTTFVIFEAIIFS